MRAPRRGCPHPEKAAYPTQDRALVLALRCARKRGQTMRAYLCPCGAWHLTHKQYRPTQGD